MRSAHCDALANRSCYLCSEKGSEVVAKGRHLLGSHVDQLVGAAGVDAQHYDELAEQVYQALVAKMKKEQL